MPPNPQPLPDVQIFIVDDDASVRMALAAMLRVEGYDTCAFESAEAFLAGMPDHPQGCALLDVRMPGMSGTDLHREMKRRGIDLPVIIVTGHGDIPMAVAAVKAGVIDFIEKPFDRDTLLAALDVALRGVSRPGAQAGGSEALRARIAGLTPREREVMDHVVAGTSNKMIAERLQIALRTVEIHRARVMEKTGARTLSELVRMAVALGM